MDSKGTAQGKIDEIRRGMGEGGWVETWFRTTRTLGGEEELRNRQSNGKDQRGSRIQRPDS